MPPDQLPDTRAAVISSLPQYATLVADRPVPNCALHAFVVRLASPPSALDDAVGLVRRVVSSMQLVAFRLEADAEGRFGRDALKMTLIIRVAKTAERT